MDTRNNFYQLGLFGVLKLAMLTLEKNINLEGKNKALSDIVRTLQKLKEIQAAGL